MQIRGFTEALKKLGFDPTDHNLEEEIQRIKSNNNLNMAQRELIKEMRPEFENEGLGALNLSLCIDEGGDKNGSGQSHPDPDEEAYDSELMINKQRGGHQGLLPRRKQVRILRQLFWH